MIFLKLFLTFLEIGTLSFGGGYGMIALMRELTLANGWLTEAELLDIVAVAESTPGPIAVNLATFIGTRQAGFFGAVIATLGVVLPAFVIILLIAALVKGLMKFKGVQAFLGGVRHAVVGLLLGTADTQFLGVVGGVTTLAEGASPDYAALGIFAALAAVWFIAKKAFHKKLSPIVMILISALLGMAVYGLIERF